MFGKVLCLIILFVCAGLEIVAEPLNKITTAENNSSSRFSPAPSDTIIVTFPNGGESWQVENSYTITWYDNLTDNVNIDLYKGGSLVLNIANETLSDGSFDWYIPYSLAPGFDYTIQITSTSDPAVFDISNSNFTVVGKTITVLSPNGGESWQVESNHTITWDDNISDNVNIDLYKGGIFQSTIATETLSDGSFDWYIPLNTPAASDYKVMITGSSNSSITDLSDANFTIVDKHITITSPNGGESWQVEGNRTITWDDNISDNVNIDLYKGGTFQSTIATETLSDGSFDWYIPLNTTSGADYTIRITSSINSSITDYSNANFTIVDKHITITSPNGGESWQVDNLYPINWEDNISENVNIDLYRGGVLKTNIATQTLSDGQFDWYLPVSIPAGSNYQIKITDSENSAITDFSNGNFTVVDKHVTVTSPNGGESWQVESNHTITWDDNISETVNIDLYMGGVLQLNIATETLSDGSFDWYIPFNTLADSDYKIKITNSSLTDIYDYSDANFTIVDKHITISSPNGGENWQVDNVYSINWDDNISENVDIDLYKGDVFQSSLATQTLSDGQFDWYIPVNTPAGTDYKVKIMGSENNAIADFSDGNFTITDKHIIVISPNGGETWQADNNYNIHWGDNISDNVDIDLFKGGVLASRIANETLSDSSFDWYIPLDTPPGNDYRIRIRSSYDSTLNDVSDADFTILDKHITITSPNGGEGWQVQNEYTITWDDNISDNVNIDLYDDNTLLSNIANSTLSDGSFSWYIPYGISPGSNCKIKITDDGDSSINDYSDAVFTIVGKEITVTSPNGGEQWMLDHTYTITWTDNISENVNIDLYKNGQLVTNIANSTLSDSSFEWYIPISIANGSDYTIKITSTDTSDINDFSDAAFTIDNVSSVEMISGYIPVQYNLYQNFPNPFNPTTTINFDLPFQSDVTIRIYNILGQLVKTIIDNEVLNAGKYRYEFDANNYSSGIYIYTINARSVVSKDSYYQIRKMILLR